MFPIRFMPEKAPRTIGIRLPVLLLKERRTFIAYTPALDFSASGSTAAKARTNFEVAVRLFLEELLERGTLPQVLQDMGWSKHERQWQPPQQISTVLRMPVRLPTPA